MVLFTLPACRSPTGSFLVYEDKVVNSTFSFLSCVLVVLLSCGHFLARVLLGSRATRAPVVEKNVSVSACGPVVFPRGLRRVFAAQQ